MIIFFQHTFTCKENDIKEDIYRLSVTDEVVRVLPPRKESQKYRDNIGYKDIWHGCESDREKKKILWKYLIQNVGQAKVSGDGSIYISKTTTPGEYLLKQSQFWKYNHRKW